MWLLTCDGDLFGGKRLWLRPGSTHLLGRTTGRSEAGERIQYIDHKSVSRKHLTIEIGQVKSGDSSLLHKRSRITVKDGSKSGTTVNGEKFSQETKTLDGKEYTMKLGSYQHTFHLWWHPVTLSFTSASKKTKTERQRLEQTDIKIIDDYIPNETTHAVAKKRNTPAVLQALLQGRFVVPESFVDALTKATESQDADGAHTMDMDFDGHWPNEDQFIVPSGSEPQPRPDSYMKPNNDRLDLFHNHVFIILAQGQFDSLLPVFTVGGGKALLREIESPDSNVRDLVEYIKGVAGRKGVDDFRLSQQTGRGGVVVIRPPHEEDQAWVRFLSDLESALDQREVRQNELLDVILTVDVSGLRRQLPVTESSQMSRASERPESRAQSQAVHQQQRAITVADSPPAAEPERLPDEAAQEEPQAEPPASRAKNRYRRHITQSRFKGFDDFDPSQFSKPTQASPEPSSENHEPSQAPDDQDMDVDEPSQPPRTQQNSRKRPAPTQEDEEEDMYASILTGHAAVKRQRMEAAQRGDKSFMSKAITDSDRAAVDKAAKAKKKAKEMDVMAEVQVRRKKEDEDRRKDEESLRNALEGVDISSLKNLAQVEEMEVPDRDRPARGSGENGRTDRWDPAWNGRKNFKKFRPQGQQNDGPRRQRVIVTLEEVPKKGRGLGDEYWLTSASSNKSKSQSQSQSQSTRQGAARSQRPAEEDEDSSRFRRRLQNSREEDQTHAATDELYAEEIAGHARDETVEAAVNSTPSQTLGTESQRKAAGKRPATQQAGGLTKKARQSKLASSSREPINLEDDDDDELKFRRRRR